MSFIKRPAYSKSIKEYEVDKILRRRIENGDTFFLIKWKGFPESDTCWEHINNLGNCGEMIQTFENESRNYVPSEAEVQMAQAVMAELEARTLKGDSRADKCKNVMERIKQTDEPGERMGMIRRLARVFGLIDTPARVKRVKPSTVHGAAKNVLERRVSASGHVEYYVERADGNKDWETLSEVDDCQDAIEHFEHQNETRHPVLSRDTMRALRVTASPSPQAIRVTEEKDTAKRKRRTRSPDASLNKRKRRSVYVVDRSDEPEVVDDSDDDSASPEERERSTSTIVKSKKPVVVVLEKCFLCRDAVEEDARDVSRCVSCARIVHTTCKAEADVSLQGKQTKGRWRCGECVTWPLPVAKVLQRRDQPAASPPYEFLVRFENQSYRKLAWVSDSWLAAVAVYKWRSFNNRVDGTSQPHVDILDEWTRVDEVLEVTYTAQSARSISNSQSSLADIQKELAKIKSVWIKWKGRPYIESTWEDPFSPEDPDYNNFCQAFRRYKRRIEVALVEIDVKSSGKRDFKKITTQPKYITGGQLKDYQMDGLNWMYYKWSEKASCLLGDEMGLGKTIQIISLLAVLYQRAKIFPFLIVVPNSVLDNWKREFNKWAPDMVVMTYGGVAEDRPLIRDHMMFHRQQLKAHVVLTTYEYANMDTFVFRKVGVWEVVVVDEGHRLKNDQSLLLKSLESIKSKFRILLTGTPIQNNIRELFQLVHFLDPKGYNDVKGISAQYEELNETKVSELHDMLKPILLRRTKDEVLHSLPGKAELIVPVSLTQLQKELYKATLAKNAKLLRSIASNRSVTTGRMASFNNILTELRKIINHPYLIDGVEPKFDPPNQLQTHQLLIDSCGKLALLHMLLKELRRRGRKVLIFSQWTRILNVLEDYLSGEDIHYLRIDGTVTSEQRQERIDKFNAPGSAYEVFLLSTRAGGVGINLATASAVVIYDQDFNPHADMQALSRAHRIGQENNVVVFKLLAKGTAEERIAQVGKKKMVLDHLVIEKLSETEVDPTDLSSILQWGAKALFDDDANDKDIKYDGEAVLAIVDKATQEAEAVKGGTGSDGPIGAFAVAQVWSKDGEVADDTEEQVDSSFWSKMLKERIAAASSVQEETYGRGVRRKARKVSWILMIDAV